MYKLARDPRSRLFLHNQPNMERIGVEEDLARRLLQRGVARRDFSRKLEKPGLVSSHKQAIREYNAMISEDPSAKRVYIVQDPKGSVSAPLEGLTKIQIKDLHHGSGVVTWDALYAWTHIQRVLYGRLCAPALWCGLIYTVLEDETGKAVLVSLSSMVVSTATDEDVAAMFPEGLQVAIKEPTFAALCSDGTVGIRVDNPADFVVIPDPAEHAGKSAGALRAEGNTFFAKGQWRKAADLYSCSIDKASVGEDLLLAYSNRAEAWLRLGRCRAAYRDAVEALKSNPGHFKSLLRKGKALAGMQCHSDAIACLTEVLRDRRKALSHSQHDEILGAVHEVKVARRQSGLGKYELDDYFVSRRCKDPPKCSEYISPGIEIRRGNEEHNAGRWGVFATRDADKGELIVCSNAAVIVRDACDSGMAGLCLDQYPYFRDEGWLNLTDRGLLPWNMDMITELVSVVRECPKVAQQIYSLQSSSTGTRTVPSISQLRSSSSPLEAYEELHYPDSTIDISRLRRIVVTNSFGFDDVKSGGLWLVPSLFNHSCTPNCSWHVVGDAIFLSAKRKIQAGEELTLSYFIVTHTWYCRKEIAGRMFFSCCCSRCLLEERLLKDVPELASLCKEYNEAHEFEITRSKRDLARKNRPIEQSAVFVSRLENILKENPSCLGLPDIHKNWLRSGFTKAYEVFYSSPKVGKPIMPIYEWVTMALESGYADVFHVLKFLLKPKTTASGCTVEVLEELFAKAAKGIYIPLKSKTVPNISAVVFQA